MIRFFGHFFDVPALCLALFELGGLFAIIVLAGVLLDGHGLPVSHDMMVAILMTLAAGSAMGGVGLYNREQLLRWENAVARALVILPLVAVLLLAFTALYDTFLAETHQRGTYLLAVASMTAFFPLLLGLRRGFLLVVDRTDIFKRRILVVGSGTRAAKIDRLCRQHQDRSFVVVGYLRFGDKPEVGEVPDGRRQSLRREDFWVAPDQLLAFCRDRKVDEMVIASTERRGMPIKELLACKLAGVTVTEYASFWEREAGEIDLDGINPGWIVYSNGFEVGLFRSAIKRALDILVSLTLLVITLPVTLVTAVLIKLESPGPLFYRQERVGLNGESFTIMKFRSMRADAEKNGPQWAAKNDSRVTRVGAFIRKVRIDELPQILNVLRGEMAFVGPRPERPVFVQSLTEKIPYYMERHVAKPGITGWAQINYPYGADIEDAKMKLSYDLYYIKNGSLFLDIIIIFQTIKVLLWNSGAR